MSTPSQRQLMIDFNNANPDFIGAIEEKVGTTYFVSMPSDTLCWLQRPSTEERVVFAGPSSSVLRKLNPNSVWIIMR